MDTQPLTLRTAEFGDSMTLALARQRSMTGGGGNDTFRFGAGSPGAIDLRDLLQGEHADGTNLDSYLDFSYDAASHATTVNVISQGTGVVDFQILLQNYDATALGTNHNAVIANMLTNGKLME